MNKYPVFVASPRALEAVQVYDPESDVILPAMCKVPLDVIIKLPVLNKETCYLVGLGSCLVEIVKKQI